VPEGGAEHAFVLTTFARSWAIGSELRPRCTPAAEAKAFGVNEPVTGDDADCEARNVEGFQVGRDIIFEARDKSLDPLFD
jgi:hypothetical protein